MSIPDDDLQQNMDADLRSCTYEGPPDRLDKILTHIWPDISRARWQALIKSGHVNLYDTLGHPDDKRPVTAKTPIKTGVQINVSIPPPEPATPQPENIPLDVLYEDDQLIVVNKPAGMVVHPAAGNPNGTLVNALLHHCRQSLSGIGGVMRPGIVHRLDKDTSGVMIAAKTDLAHQHLAQQFADHSIHRIYSAVVWGHPAPAQGRIEGNIGRHPVHRQKMAVVETGGKHAVTHYETIKIYTPTQVPKAALIRCKLETGRTHQIRVHMTKIGFPLVGDPTYSVRQYAGTVINLGQNVASDEFGTFCPNTATFSRQALHAGELGYIHPLTGENHLHVSKIPNDFNSLCSFLEK